MVFLDGGRQGNANSKIRFWNRRFVQGAWEDNPRMREIAVEIETRESGNSIGS